jgi:outer membrane immunogenic protein
MKKLATCAVAVTGLLGTSAFAADIGVKAPLAPPPAPVYNWTGWYVGVNAGASFGTADTDFHGAPVFAVNGAVTNHITSAFAFSDQSTKRIHGWWSDRLQLAVLPSNCRGG